MTPIWLSHYLSISPSHFSLFSPSREEIQHSHAHGHAVGDLIEDNGALVVDNLTGKIYASVYRPRMHNPQVRVAFEVFEADAEAIVVFAEAREETRALPFELDA